MSLTAARILDAAQELTQKRGFNAFSYADIAQRIGIRKASIHYHFRSKAELGVNLIERYRKDFGEELAKIDSSLSEPKMKVKRYIKLYEGTLSNDRMCLCGMLASEITTMPTDVQDSVWQFFEENEKWLANIFSRGRSEGFFEFQGSAKSLSKLFLSSVQGALLVSRAMKSEKHFNTVTRELLRALNK